MWNNQRYGNFYNNRIIIQTLLNFPGQVLGGSWCDLYLLSKPTWLVLCFMLTSWKSLEVYVKGSPWTRPVIKWCARALFSIFLNDVNLILDWGHRWGPAPLKFRQISRKFKLKINVIYVDVEFKGTVLGISKITILILVSSKNKSIWCSLHNGLPVSRSAL